MPGSFWQEHKKVIKGLAATLILMLAVFFMQESSQEFMATLLQVEQPAPFDGTALPIQKVPNWSKLSSTEYKLSADLLGAEKLTKLPNYDPADFNTTLASLTWGVNNELRNKLITYAVPYMGSYETSSKEYDGSHLAVDIKTPIGTPVHAVANGKVVKIADGSGFGKHVVIEHPNVPDLDKNETIALYSAYAHLSEMNVTKGQIVRRGELIGKSGNSGTSTTPHLHFQIDRASAPWHPWWPFSSAEASAAGLNFFSGISEGLNQDQAIANTINPMLWVQRYLVTGENTVPADLHASANTTNTSTNTTTANTNTNSASNSASTNTTSTNTSTTTATTTNTTETKPVKVTYEITGDKLTQVGEKAKIQILAKDPDGNPTNPTETTILEVGSDEEISLAPSKFKNGVADVEIESDAAKKIILTIEGSKAKYEIQFIEKAGSISGFTVETAKPFLIASTQEVVIRALDTDGNLTPATNFPGTVKLTTSTGKGDFSTTTLTRDDFVNGEAKVTLAYTDTDQFKIKAQEGALIGESKWVYPRLFSDITDDHENYKAISYLKEKGIISGYPDGSFQPDRTVARVEALKMILLGLGIELTPAETLRFPDTDKGAWYAGFVGRAMKLGIAKGYPDGSFGPAKTVNRAEYLKMLLNAAEIETSTVEDGPYSDVPADAWYAPFADYSKNKNIFPLNGSKFVGIEGVTRAQVAETIYRMLVLEKTGMAEYDESLSL